MTSCMYTLLVRLMGEFLDEVIGPTCKPDYMYLQSSDSYTEVRQMNPKN